VWRKQILIKTRKINWRKSGEMRESSTAKCCQIMRLQFHPKKVKMKF